MTGEELVKLAAPHTGQRGDLYVYTRHTGGTSATLVYSSRAAKAPLPGPELHESGWLMLRTDKRWVLLDPTEVTLIGWLADDEATGPDPGNFL